MAGGEQSNKPGPGPSDQDIEALLREIQDVSAKPSSAPQSPGQPAAQAFAGPAQPPQAPADALLKNIDAIISGELAAKSQKPAADGVRPASFPSFEERKGGTIESNVDMLMDVSMNLKVELGRCKMPIADILKLGRGSVVELEKLAGDPLEIFVNDRLVARGEVLVLNDNFCIRVTEVMAPKENK
jgi:flagellar motor switch protein FliN/FliY